MVKSNALIKPKDLNPRYDHLQSAGAFNYKESSIFIIGPQDLNLTYKDIFQKNEDEAYDFSQMEHEFIDANSKNKSFATNKKGKKVEGLIKSKDQLPSNFHFHDKEKLTITNHFKPLKFISYTRVNFLSYKDIGITTGK